jgi:TonB-linked SusC/RagA family outer membrane protein
MRRGLSRPVALLLALLAGAGFSELQAQQTIVRGTIVNDATNQPVEEATVLVSGTQLGTRTNARGEFSLAVRSLRDTIVVNRLGYSAAREAINGRSTVDIRLRAVAVMLGETVVVGYGTQKRSDVTGAVASVDAERISGTPNTSAVQALQGAVPGVSIVTGGAGAEQALDIKIRGRSSISASTDPLVVLDGIPYEGPLSEINPGDISSIEVLKDASSTAIYGSRGSNGVLLITTKRGGTGAPKISYRGYAGTQSITNVPAVMNGQQFARFKCTRLAPAGSDCTSEAVIEDYLTPSEMAGYRAGVSTDWMGLAMRDGSQQSHDLTVSGGSEDTKYFLGGGLLRVNGVARGDAFERYSARVNLDQQLRKWLHMGTNTTFAQVDRSGQGASFSDAFYMNPLVPAFDSTGTQLISPWAEDVFWANPLEGLLARDDDQNRRIFTSNYVQVTVPQLPGLSYRFNGGMDFSTRESGTYYGRDTRTGSIVLGRATSSNTRRRDWTAENIVRYQRDFGVHRLDLTTLFSMGSNSLRSVGLRGEGFPNDVLGYHQSSVAALLVPSETITDSKLVSQMARLNYAFGDRYLVTGTVRRDGYSGFGRNHKYGVFPSIALGWNVTEEPFWHAKAINNLKVRASYGSGGNQAVQPYRTLAQLDDYSYIENDQTAPGYRPVTLGNPDLRWETTNSANLGVDFGLFGSRIDGSLEIYQRWTRDLLLQRTISPTHGLGSVTQNIGKTQNRGVELGISSVNLQRRGFAWRSALSFTANRNKITDLYGDATDDVASRWFIGQPITVNYDYEFGGIWQAGDDIANSAQPTAKPGDVRIVDQNGDKKIDAADLKIIGSREPSYEAGLSNTVTLGAFELTGYLYTVQGVTRENPLLGTNQVQSGVRRNTIPMTYWTPENQVDNYPANREGSNPLSVGFFQDASFVRLRDLQLAWNVPARLASRAGLNGFKVYVNGRNLWTSSDWTGLDPELGDQRAIPLEKSVVLGVNFGF